MLKGGGMYETGAGGSAPKHVQQVLEENHLRWDSLGEFMALAVSLEDMGIKQGNKRAAILAQTLDAATGKLLKNDKSPSRKTGELDNRGSHYYLGMYWAEALGAQTDDADLAKIYAPFAKKMAANEEQIISELRTVQGTPAAVNGYYHASRDDVKAVMRASTTLNGLLAEATAAAKA
jgi:isocitrate dehydrogenase